MWSTESVSRRSFLAAAKKKIPLGLELYSVRDILPKDLFGVVRAVAKMGYEGVEFYAPYYSWKPDYAKEVRKLLDDLGIKCYSTHNGANAFAPENLAKSVELNQIIGSKIIVMASAGKVDGIDGWKKVADQLNQGAAKFKTAGMRAGYHNHAAEFRPIGGVKPLDVVAKNTTKDVTLQLDVGTCVEAGSDPVAWINQYPGRTARTGRRTPPRATRFCSATATRPGRRSSRRPRRRAASSTISSSRKAAPIRPSIPWSAA
jgi:sugar phosphate isomerase/epimerase